MVNPRVIMSPFWLTVWAATLAMGWLLPNHYPPWMSFHADAWVAMALLLAAAAVLLRADKPVVWHRMTLWVAALVCFPGLHYAFGLVLQLGVVWVNSIYLLGLVLAMLVGAQWERDSPSQVLDGFFLAVGMAAIISVGLQFPQWLQVDSVNIWSMGGGFSRPSANFGQPNQLGTLLLWGILAAGWGVVRQLISGKTATLMTVFLLFGLALTGSRTTWLAVSILVTATWIWRNVWSSTRVVWVVTGLGLYFVVCVFFLRNLQLMSMADAGLTVSHSSGMSGDLRTLVWTALFDAMLQRPWLGYGWGQVALAQMEVATQHPYIPGVFAQSHNLFLDLLLWCGIPLGLGIIGSLIVWLWKRLRAVQCAQDAITLLILLVVGNHAMFEYPLHYGYFLWPVGLVIGVVNARLGAQVVMQSRRWVGFTVWLATSLFFALIVRDYSRVEASFQTLSMEWMHFKISSPVVPPDVLLLTQWRDYIELARLKPEAGVSQDQLDRLSAVVGLNPNFILFHKLATALAMNQRPQEARLWLQRMCKVVPGSQCAAVEKEWARQALVHPEIAAIPWPATPAN